MQIGQLSQTRISKINQNFVVMKFYQIWIGALPLQQRCSKHSMDIQGSQMYFSEQWVTGEDYERGAKDCFVCSSNIHLNYQGLHPRIPQCIMDTCKKQIISEMSTWSKEIVKNESLGNALTQLRTFPSAFREQNNEALCLGEAAPEHLAKGSFWLSEFYRISNGLLEGLHNALGVQRRTSRGDMSGRC
nr:unnamed protein product [Spirometra erinaceieuropaei]